MVGAEGAPAAKASAPGVRGPGLKSGDEPCRQPPPWSASLVAPQRRQVADTWDQAIVPALSEYIRIPNKSPAFDPEWKAHGHMERAVEHIATWCRGRKLPGAKVEVVRLKDQAGKDRTPGDPD